MNNSGSKKLNLEDFYRATGLCGLDACDYFFLTQVGKKKRIMALRNLGLTFLHSESDGPLAFSALSHEHI